MNSIENSKVPKLFEVLKERGITAKTLSLETGIPQSTITDWKNGRTVPPIDKFFAIANYLNLSVDYLLGRTEHDGVINNGSNNTIQNGNGNTVNSSSPLEDNEVWETYSKLSTKDKLEVKLDIMNRGSKWGTGFVFGNWV